MYQRKDAFYQRAKGAGYRSRAAFKLLELAQRGKLLRAGDHVVDLGAWPGGWLQVAAQLVGPSGKVVGVDLQPIEPLPQANVVTLVGDIGAASTQDSVSRACEGRVDVVLSDLAPKLSGIRARDEARAQALAETAAVFAERLLRPGGILVVKMFMSPDLPQYVATLRGRFAEVRTSRVEATRKGSAEVYVVAKGFKRSSQDS
ncbi:MAG: rRNA methyltransferase [Deltaproteobacteria bacterium]|nr:rRNA methyltransferase [Deltaproteobacteria bacterium]